jgi:hypothetical protein
MVILTSQCLNIETFQFSLPLNATCHAQVPFLGRFPMMATIDITKLSKDVLDYPNAEATTCAG